MERVLNMPEVGHESKPRTVVKKKAKSPRPRTPENPPKRASPARRVPIWERSSAWDEERTRRCKSLQHHKQQAELKECSFTPCITQLAQEKKQRSRTRTEGHKEESSARSEAARRREHARAKLETQAAILKGIDDFDTDPSWDSPDGETPKAHKGLSELNVNTSSRGATRGKRGAARAAVSPRGFIFTSP